MRGAHWIFLTLRFGPPVYFGLVSSQDDSVRVESELSVWLLGRLVEVDAEGSSIIRLSLCRIAAVIASAILSNDLEGDGIFLEGPGVA